MQKTCKIAHVGLYLLLPFLVLFMLRWYGWPKILFESILLTGLLSFLFIIFAQFFITKKFKKSFTLRLGTVFTIQLVAFNLLFFSTMMVDRSKSLYLVAWVGQEKSIEVESLFEKIEAKYGDADRQYLKLRISEQIERKVIHSDNNKLELSEIGTFYFKVANLVAFIYDLKGWKNTELDS
jgi:hypothetical protein